MKHTQKHSARVARRQRRAQRVKAVRRDRAKALALAAALKKVASDER